MASDDHNPFPGLRGFFSWVRGQFPAPGLQTQEDEVSTAVLESEATTAMEPPETISRRELAAALGRDCYPEWFSEYGEHVWQDEIEGKKALELVEHQREIDQAAGVQTESQPNYPDYDVLQPGWENDFNQTVVEGLLSVAERLRIESDPTHPEHAEYVLQRHKKEVERAAFSVATDWVDDFRDSVRREFMREIEAELGSLTEEDRELLGQLWKVQTHLFLKQEEGCEAEEMDEWDREYWERNEAFAALLTEADRKFLSEEPPDRPGVRDAIKYDELGYQLSFRGVDHDGFTFGNEPRVHVFYSGQDCAGLLPDRICPDSNEWIVWRYGNERRLPTGQRRY